MPEALLSIFVMLGVFLSIGYSISIVVQFISSHKKDVITKAKINEAVDFLTKQEEEKKREKENLRKFVKKK